MLSQPEVATREYGRSLGSQPTKCSRSQDGRNQGLARSLELHSRSQPRKVNEVTIH